MPASGLAIHKRYVAPWPSFDRPIDEELERLEEENEGTADSKAIDGLSYYVGPITEFLAVAGRDCGPDGRKTSSRVEDVDRRLSTLGTLANGSVYTEEGVDEIGGLMVRAHLAIRDFLRTKEARSPKRKEGDDLCSLRCSPATRARAGRRTCRKE